MGSVGNVWMFEYEAHIKEKWLEGHGLRQDEIYLREAYRRAEAEQRWKHRSGKSIMKHLKENNMSWGMHLWYALTLAYRLCRLSLIAVVHGLLPFIFTSKVSDGVHKLNEELS